MIIRFLLIIASISGVLSACIDLPQGQGSDLGLDAQISKEIVAISEGFSSLQPLPAGEGLADYNYSTKEYFVTGIANGSLYKTRIIVRKPTDKAKFSGLVLTETMHPSGNAWLFHFTHRYTMSSGHIGVEIVVNGLDAIQRQNTERYKDLIINEGQEYQIIAQVGALLKSDSPDNPIAGLGLRKMILAGTSASANVLIDYLPTHMTSRLSEGAAIYDGFLPTSNDRNIDNIDVPIIQVPTMTELTDNSSITRQDSDEAGFQFRGYETAGIAHLDTKDVATFKSDLCAKPVSLHPIGTGFSVALHHLFKWVDEGIIPPRAQRILLDGDVNNDDSMMALDQHGNVQGGLPSPYVNVPVAKYGVRNEAREDNQGSFPAVLCRLAGYQLNFTKEQLGALYSTKEQYLDSVQQAIDELIRAGWLLPVDAEIVMLDAQKINF